MAAKMNLLISLALFGLFALTSAQSYINTEINAWHFHSYFFEVNDRSVAEATNFRKALRELINDRTLDECSLNYVAIGWDGPHPVSQFEMCCNKTSYNAANSWIVQNHGNLSVLIHPLTEYDLADHIERVSWIGAPVVVDTESPFLYPFLPKPRPCPVYPPYSDEIRDIIEGTVKETVVPIAGTEDYKRRNRNFNILTDNY